MARKKSAKPLTPAPTFHISGGHVQVGDHNVQTSTPAEAGRTPPATIGRETSAGLVRIIWRDLKKRPLLMRVAIVALFLVGTAYGLAKWGPAIKRLFSPQQIETKEGVSVRTPIELHEPIPTATPVPSPWASASVLSPSAVPSPAKEASQHERAARGVQVAEAKPPGPVFNISGGQVQVGDHNVQNTIIAPRSRSVSQSVRDELLTLLRSKPTHRFSVVTGFDNDSHAVGAAIFDTLKAAGWTPVALMPTTPTALVSVNQIMPTPARRGVTIYVKPGSPELAASEVIELLRWCQRTGLQPREVGSPSLEQSRPFDLLIEVGDPPDPP